jgi:hypothetical protein
LEKVDRPQSASNTQRRQAWDTEEGAVVIEQQGDKVLVTESLQDTTTTTLEKEVFTK